MRQFRHLEHRSKVRNVVEGNTKRGSSSSRTEQRGDPASLSSIQIPTPQTGGWVTSARQNLNFTQLIANRRLILGIHRRLSVIIFANITFINLNCFLKSCPNILLILLPKNQLLQFPDLELLRIIFELNESFGAKFL